MTESYVMDAYLRERSKGVEPAEALRRARQLRSWDEDKEETP